jgi:predicted DNA-binding protein (UPF0251 family)
MNNRRPAIVVFGDVVGSRQGAAAATAWLERLCALLDRTYGDQRLAPFDFTQGDELQGLLDLSADPFVAVLEGNLRPRKGRGAAPSMRWVTVCGEVDPGRGPSTRRTGPAFVIARETIEEAGRSRDGLLCRTGDPRSDALLEGTAPVMAAMIERMTDRQREVARLALVDGLRQSEIAERLGVARATVSVSFARGDVRNLGRLLGAVRAIWSEGVAAGEQAA